MKILAFESSCDETAVAIYDTDSGLKGHLIHSQIALHNLYGGVVPELASRDHIKKCLPLLKQLLAEQQQSLKDIDGICYTAGPGLLGAVLVGATFARGLAYALDIPTLGVHHMEGHLLAPMLAEHKPVYPFLALLVSGGHTQLIDVQGLGQYELLGETLDDATGEAFDKTAKMLGLPYPGGAELSALARTGDSTRFTFPKPMTDRPGLDFSFSGLKTFTVQLVQKLGQLDDQTRADVAAGFEAAIAETLVIKCQRALKQTGLRRLVVSGGVSANHLIRQKLNEMAIANQAEVYFPPLSLCTDNAAMIAYAGAQRMLRGERDGATFQCRARWPLTELNS